jgi:AraC family transcriptional regulator of adaptative response / DNA-3-methyladenine glycosylase II
VGRDASGAVEHPEGTWLTLRLAYRQPLDSEALLDFLALRAVPGLEQVRGYTYSRTVHAPAGAGVIELSLPPTQDDQCDGQGSKGGRRGSRAGGPVPGQVLLRVRLPRLRGLGQVVSRCRQMLDLDADPQAINAALAADDLLAPLVAARPGLRVPGAYDGFELAVRAVLGQQVSLAAARTFASRIVTKFGTRLPSSGGTGLTGTEPTGARLTSTGLTGTEPTGTELTDAEPADAGAAGPELAGTGLAGTGPTRTGTARAGLAGSPAGSVAEWASDGPALLFPGAASLAEADLSGLGLTTSRQRTLRGLATAVASDGLALDRGADPEETAARLAELPGIGPWTVAYILMRAVGDPDAFPASDLGLRRALERLGGDPSTARDWRPWRAYAAVHLWAWEADQAG